MMQRAVLASLALALMASSALARPPMDQGDGDRAYGGDQHTSAPVQATPQPMPAPAAQPQARPQSPEPTWRGRPEDWPNRIPRPQGSYGQRPPEPQTQAAPPAPPRPQTAPIPAAPSQSGYPPRPASRPDTPPRWNDRDPGHGGGSDRPDRDRDDHHGSWQGDDHNEHGPRDQGRSSHGGWTYDRGHHDLRDRDQNRYWYSPDRYRSDYLFDRRFRVDPFRAPYGYYSHAWRYGETLPYGWYSTGRYLDWWYFGLPRPPIGCEWVRLGSDAVLVDIWTGRVLSVAWRMFW